MKARIISLGCAKNLVDTEVLMGMLKEKGYEFTPLEEDADLILLNTCAFISPACEETEKTIEELRKYKKENKKIVVCGCYIERFKSEIANKFPFVDLFIGPSEYENFKKYLENNYYQKIFTKPIFSFLPTANYLRIRVTPKHWAYVKIADGCSNFCTYCTIPYIRGALRSREIDDIKKEVINLVKEGVKEINIIAQDTTRYGEDIYGKPSLLNLLKELDKIPGNFWIRILYLHPLRVNLDLINLIKNSDKIIPYFDIPLQHVNNKLLKRMGRNYTKKDIINLWENIKKTLPQSVLRTTFIVGFPGEKEKDFEEILNFIEEYTFERVGVFPYYPEKETKAYKFSDHINDDEKIKRFNILMRKQKDISKKLNLQLLGEYIDVLIESKNKNYYLSRSWREAPEVDPVIFVRSSKELNLGDKVRIKIKKAGSYDLWGEVI